MCAYLGFSSPPEEFSICPCCGTEFGVDDFALTPEAILEARRQLRTEWLLAGAPWFDPGTPQPAGWNARDQLLASTERALLRLGSPLLTLDGPLDIIRPVQRGSGDTTQEILLHRRLRRAA